MPIAKVNDINMYYEMHGGGEPLVLIAGLGTDLTVYEPIINELSQKSKVLAFDNRGVGRTDKPDAPYAIEMMADDTAALMSGVGIEKAHVLGISMGGRIAMALALQHPDKVKSLVLTSYVRDHQDLPVTPGSKAHETCIRDQVRHEKIPAALLRLRTAA